MDHDFIMMIVEVVIVLCAFFFGYLIIKNKNVTNTVEKATSEMNFITKYADTFISWAKEFMSDKSGAEKMEEVVTQLSTIAERYKLDISADEIKAIAQKAYDEFKYGETYATNFTIEPTVTATSLSSTTDDKKSE